MLDDKYRIERLLATGGMGSVYLGTHVRLHKRVAIKVLNPQLSSSMMIERFHREAITASQIGHEGIAQVTDLGTSDLGEPFLVMEYLEGESLGSRLKAAGPLAIEDACELGVAILSPLAAAHRAGIVHRDLKPDNVFLVRQSRGEMVKLLDFGISRMVDRDATFRLTTTGLVLGTPYYMSPEQARGDGEVTIAADLYAFGVMLYEMLIGEVPIRAENYNQLMYRVMIGDFVRPGQRRHDLPEVLDQIIVRAMAQEPAARPASANDIEHALLPLCRPGFRDATSGRLSAPGLPFRSSGAGGGSGGSGTGSGHGMPVAATLRDQHPAGHSGISGVGTRPDRPPAVYGTSPGGAAATVPNAPPRRAGGRIIAVVAAIAVVGAVIVAIALGGSGPAPGIATSSAPAVAPTAPPTAAPPPAAPPTAAPPPAVPSPPAGAAAQADPGPAAQPAAGVQGPASAPTAAPAGPPARAATITLRLAIEPEAASVTIDGKPVSGPEIEVPRDDRLHRLKIIAPGYRAHEERVAFDENQRLVVHLERAAPGRGRTPRKDPDGITSQSPYD